MPGNTGLRAEPDGDAPDEVNFHSKVKKNPLKKRCGSQPHHAAAAPPIFFWGGKPRPGASISDGMGASISDGGLQLKWDLYILRSLL